ncbi:MAG: Gfo/Idh/MocA family oxidoreductase [Armatimonadetes bacterium]|nr:Gfo/Idh/MocA family oxidoreductase [Armatimonadota bacterium]
MSIDKANPTRRQVLAATGSVVAATTLTGFDFSSVHPDGSDLIQVAIVGCGGRGSGAIVNALKTKSGPIKLIAMADAFEDRLKSSYTNVSKEVGALMDVPEERKFVGFDAYKKAMDCLKPGDIVILTTPPAFRWVHFQYAISKKLNVFMEKPVTVDGPTSKKMLKLGRDASVAGLKVGVGLMSRHAVPLQQLQKRIEGGEIGDIMLMRAYRMHGPAGTMQSLPNPGKVSDLEYQIRRFHSFLWASGGCFSDFYIHLIDHAIWMKNALPVSARASGGRHYKQSAEGVAYVDQNLDTYSVEYTFADGTKFYFDGRCVEGAEGKYASYIHGTKGCAIASRANDCGGPSAIYKGQNMDESKLLWQSTDNTNPYQNEWDALVTAIRTNKPFNEVRRGVETSLVTSMGRMAAHTGQEITFDAMLECEHEFAPGLDTLTSKSPAPLVVGANGHYPQPMPGVTTDREF